MKVKIERFGVLHSPILMDKVKTRKGERQTETGIQPRRTRIICVNKVIPTTNLSVKLHMHFIHSLLVSVSVFACVCQLCLCLSSLLVSVSFICVCLLCRSVSALFVSFSFAYLSTLYPSLKLQSTRCYKQQWIWTIWY